MMYLVIAYNDNTTLGLMCDNFYLEGEFVYTSGEGYAIKDVIPGHNVKAISRISEEEFEAYKLEDEEDDEPES